MVNRAASRVLRVIYEGILSLILLNVEIIKAIFKFFVPPPLKDVSNEVVLITGAGHGMGREMALRFARLGAVVVCVDINAKGNQETLLMIKEEKGKAHSYQCDVTDRKAIFALAEKIRLEVGEVTILVNNAGIMPCKPVLEQTEAEISRMMDINVNANLWTIQAFLPSMLKKNYGHIVAMASTAGLIGVRNLVSYCGSKFAVRGIMKALAIELADNPEASNIKTTTVFPSIVDTGLCKNPRIKYPSIIDVIKPGLAADVIVDAVRRNYMEVAIPTDLYYTAKYFFGLLPFPALKIVDNFLGTGVDPQD